MRAATLPTLCEWIVKALDELDVNTIVKKCGISNRHDGTEDDMLWDDVDPPAGDAMDIDSDVEDPYDGMVTPQDWLDLYGNSDDDVDPGMSLNCAPTRVCRKSASRPGYVVKVRTDPGYVVKQCPRIVMNKIFDWH